MATIAETLNRALHYQRQGQLPEAEQLYRQVLDVDPENVDALHLLGTVASELGKFDVAVQYFTRAIALQDWHAAIHANLGVAYARWDKLDEAIVATRRALSLDANLVEAHFALGAMLHDQGRFDEALASYTRAAELNPAYAAAHFKRGGVLQRLDRGEEALAAFRQALALEPNNAEAQLNAGVILGDRGELSSAIEHLDAALRASPGLAMAHYNRAVLRLMLGDFSAGWPEYEHRRRLPNAWFGPWSQPQWDGSSLVGKTIVLHPEQGAGDAFQFIRYAPLVKACGGTVILYPSKPLAAVLGTCAGIDQVVCMGEELPPFDVYSPLMSLPAIFHTDLTSIPADVPYLSAEVGLVDAWRGKLGGSDCLRVGIGWQGNPRYRLDRERSIALGEFALLAAIDGARLISLQKGPGVEQLATAPFKVQDLSARLDCSGEAFRDTAAVIKNLDLVITSDTALAHLAGALGAPVWVGLPAVADWRWLCDRADCPWYPTMKLFRQRAAGDWPGVFRAMAAELSALVLRRPAAGGEE